MADNTTTAVGPADAKRQRISKAQQYTLLEVLGASLVLGTCIVIATFLIKYINFNAKIITEKDNAITSYDQTLRNVGICIDKDKNGRLSNEEIEQCNPDKVSLDKVKDSLRYKVWVEMAQNEDLESVARQRNANCYNQLGERIDFTALYALAEDETQRQQYLQSAKICSALRVIPDALPSVKNTEALMASVNQVLILTGWEPDRLAPRDDSVDSQIEGVDVIPITLRIESQDAVVLGVLHNMERSIREFDITSATVEWTNFGLNLQVSANAYYLSELPQIEVLKTVYASPKARSSRK